MQATIKVSSDMDSSPAKLQQRMAWLRQDPGNASLYRQCADDATALHRHDLLLEIADRALEKDPSDPASRFDRANAQIGLRDYRAALATLAGLQVAATEQQNAIKANRALCHYCLQEYAQALPHLMSEYQRGLRSAQLLFMLVRSNHYLGQFDQAVAIANANATPAAHDPALAGAYALLFLDAEDAASASRWAATALRLDPSSIDGSITEATVAIMRLQTDRAQQLFDAVLETAPETGRAWIGLGTLAMLQQDLHKAVAHLERGVQLMPEYVGGWHMLAWSQLLQQNLQAAENALNEALALDRNFAETHGALAALDVMKGDHGSAQHRLIVARRLDPKCFSAQFATALLEDPALKCAQSQEILQRTLLSIAGQNQSALGRLLLKGPKH